MAETQNPKRRAWLTLALLAVLFLAVLAISSLALRSARLDLTQDGLYTLSDGTREVLRDLEEPVTLKFYFSDEAATGYAQLKAYANRVEDLLKEYQALAGGDIALEVIDPEPFSEAEDEAVAYGLRAARTPEGENIYFGLVAQDAADGLATIPFFAQEREASLEYDLTKLIQELARPVRPRLAIVSSLPLQFGPGGMAAVAQGRAQPYIIYEQLTQLFEVETLGQDFTRVPAGVDVLLVAHATDLSDAAFYGIDQYVLGGGAAIVFVDPYSETAALMSGGAGPLGMPQPGPATSSDLEPLLENWGVKLEPAKVVADLGLAQRVDMGGFASGGRQIVDYVPWLAIDQEHLAEDDIVTGELASISMASAGALRIDGQADGITPLITSSQEAALIDVIDVSGRPDPDRLIRNLQPTGETYVLAARIRRPLETAFPGGAPEGDASEEEEPSTDPAADGDVAPPSPHVARSDGPANVIVVADADLLEDRFWAQVQDFLGSRVVVPIADNARFVINAADQLSGSDALISLRSRGVSSRPFTLVDDIRRDAERDYLAEQQRLEDELAVTEQRLRELEGGEAEGEAILTAEQEAEIDRFRAQVIATRQALRDVQRNLRRDIDRLEAWIIALNILAIPVILIAVALLMGWRRRARRRAAA